MRPRRVVLLESSDDELRGRTALLLRTWGYAVAAPLKCLAEPACVLLCGYRQVSEVRAAMEICVSRWQDLPVLVVGDFASEERTVLLHLGARRVLPEAQDFTMLREALMVAMAVRRGPKAMKKYPSSVLAPLAVAMEAAV